MRILIVDDALADSKALKPLFAGGKKTAAKVRASAGAPDISRLLVARAPSKQKAAAKNAGRKKLNGRAGTAESGNLHLDLGDQPEQTSAILDALGICLLNRGVPEGAALIELGLKIRRKAFGNDHPFTALSLNSYSRVLREAGDYEGAIDSAQDALRIDTQVFGARGYPVVDCLLELGFTQLLQGNFEAALKSAEEGLSILKELNLYETDPDSTRLMDVIGRALCNLGRLDEAADTYKVLLALDRKQLGTKNHPKYAVHLANYGLVLEAQKKFTQAANNYRTAIDLYTQALNLTQQPNLIDLYANLGSLLRGSGDLAESRKYLQLALDLGRKIRGDTHPLTGNDYANLARWHYDSGTRIDAADGFTQALNIYKGNVTKKELPADHFFIAEALTWQGRIAVETDTPAGGKKAEPLLQKAIDIWPRQLGPNTTGEWMAKGYLGRAMALRGIEDTTESCRLLCEAYNALKLNPPSDPTILQQFEQWIEEQQCECGESPSAS